MQQVDGSSRGVGLSIMAPTPLILLQLVFASLAFASHYYGGVTNVRYGGTTSSGQHIVVIDNRDTYDSCSYSHSWSCYQGQCGSVYGQQNMAIDNSINAPYGKSLWCETESRQTRYVSSDKPFQLRASGCCWINTRNSVSNWRLLTYVDLGRRSDTNQPNRSPDIAILPVLRVPQNCPRTYKLAAYDPDGDRVRCRYGSQYDVECSGCSLPSGFQLDQDSCTLHYISTTSHSYSFGFEMVVEDFPQRQIFLTYSDGSRSFRSPPTFRAKRSVGGRGANSHNRYARASYYYSSMPTTASPTYYQTIYATQRPNYYYTTESTTEPIYPTTTATPPFNPQTTPLSKLPLHFSFVVDSSAPSCTPGLYIPKYESPTPEDGAFIRAEVNKEMQIRVKATSSVSTIDNIIFSGPQGTRKAKNTHNEFVISWTPTSDDLGHYYSICFAVESKSGSSVYQTDMRCVTVDVTNKTVEAKVICSQSEMRVEIDKSTFPRLSEDHLRLSDPSDVICSLKTHSNSTHVIAIIPLSACGTEIEEDDEYLKFKNEITTFDDYRDVITRKHLLEVQFYCQYPKQGNVTQSFTAHRRNVTVWEKGFGRFTYDFEFYPNSQYLTMIDPDSYPLEYDLGSRIYMQIEATSSVNNTELFVESCRAAPYDNPNYRPDYSIIENGCTVDSTTQIHSPNHQNQFQFSVEAFKFIGLHDQVYISCSVIMCQAGEPNTRCAQGCVQSRSYRHKRAALTQSATHLISQGPLRLMRSVEVKSADNPAPNLNLNLVFIAGCLLAAVGMVSGVAVYKAKVKTVKYQPLPVLES